MQDQSGETPTIPARGLFKGHKDTVEDVQFKPNSYDEFCSVGDDHCLLLWDAREGTAPVIQVRKHVGCGCHCSCECGLGLTQVAHCDCDRDRDCRPQL